MATTSSGISAFKERSVGVVLILLFLSSACLLIATTFSSKRPKIVQEASVASDPTDGCVDDSFVFTTASSKRTRIDCLLSSFSSFDTTRDGQLAAIPTQIGLLSQLTHLSLTGQDIEGTLPSEIGKLTTLRSLRISNTQLTGGLPTELGRLAALTSLDMTNNGKITDLLGDTRANLGAAQSGFFRQRFPTDLVRLTLLRELTLAGNGLAGPLPFMLFSRLPSLAFLDVSKNALTGALPILPHSLKYLYLGLNQLTGPLNLQPIPTFGSPSSLVALDVGGNMLAGALPTSDETMSRMAEIEYLVLSNNFFEGAMPERWGDLDKLVWLDVSNNTLLSGTIPDGLEHLLATQSVNVEDTSIAV